MPGAAILDGQVLSEVPDKEVGGWTSGGHPHLVNDQLSQNPGNGKPMARQGNSIDKEDEKYCGVKRK